MNPSQDPMAPTPPQPQPQPQPQPAFHESPSPVVQPLAEPVQPSQPAAAPVEAQPQPVDTTQPIVASAPVVEPMQPQPAPIAVEPQPQPQPVMAPAPMPQTQVPISPQSQTPYNPNGAPKKAFPKKLMMIIGGGIAGFALLGAGIWLLANFLGGSQLTLKTYETEYYSVLVPEAYEQTRDSSSESRFVSVDSKASEDNGVLIMRQAFPSGVAIDDDMYDDLLETVSNSYTSDNSTNVIAKKIDHKGYRAISVSMDVRDESGDGINEGKANILAVIGSDALYIVLVGAINGNDDGLEKAVQKILNSFTIK
jgi:hypothetical protein